MSIVTVSNIHRSFGKVKAVRGLSFSIERGQVVGFIGANGSGKTTTMRLMVTLDAPDSGSIEICGINTIDHPRDVRRLVGWMPDHFETYANMDVAEYLDFYGRAFGLSPSERKRRIDEVMAFTDLDVLAERPSDALSKGQTQRLGLARALLSDPQVLVLDEPAAGLDPKARIEFRNLVKLLSEQGKTLFISSHILSELGEMCDSMLFIDDGRELYQGNSDSLLADRNRDILRVQVRTAGDPLRLEQWLSLQPQLDGRSADNGATELRITRDANGDEGAQLAALLAQMLSAGIAVHEFHRVERRLEDVFVELLGEHKA